MSTSNEAGNNGAKPIISMTWDHETGLPTGDVYVQASQHSRPRKVPRTEEEIDRAFPQYTPKPQEHNPLPQATLELFKKASDSPSALTEEERLEVLGWVPEDVVDERCQKACGTTWANLIAIAVHRPEELTIDQVHFIELGRARSYGDLDADFANLSSIIHQSDDVRELRHSACSACEPIDYVTAVTNARSVQQRLEKLRAEGLAHLSEEDHSCIRHTGTIPWIEGITSSTQPHWGLVCFRTAYNDTEAWQRYKQHLSRWSSVGLSSKQGTDYIATKWKIEFIEDDQETLDQSSIEDLCRIINHPMPSSKIALGLESGLRSDTFLFADAAAIASLNDPPTDGNIGISPKPETSHLVAGYVNAVDASYDPAKVYANDFKGVLKVHPVHIAATFYQRLIPKNGGGEKEREKWWVRMQNWENMYKRANGRFGREGGVYPPKSTANR